MPKPCHPKTLLQLFGKILRLHRKLPPPMRSIGDRYLRDEFRRHRDAQPPLTSTQWHEFRAQWQAYANMLDGTADRLPDGTENVQGGLAVDVVKELNPQQQERLLALQREAYRAGMALHAELKGDTLLPEERVGEGAAEGNFVGGEGGDRGSPNQ